MSGDVAVRVEGVAKRFRLYHDRNQSLKATILNRGRASFEEFWALDGIDFEVHQGETFGLIGHNGSGKSTMLKCLARILEPDRGRISVEGRVSALLELGAGFHPELSGRENVYLNASILGMGRKEVDARFDEIVGFAGLERFIDTPVKNYSSGMYVRLGFAVAVQASPDVLLIDEVLAVGDEEFQRRCNERLSELRHAGVTIIVVSHAMGAVRNICDRVAWFDHGAQRAVGDADDLIDDYLAEVEVHRTGPPAEGSRWGTGSLRFDSVEVIGADGSPAARVATGDHVRIRAAYTAEGSLEDVTMGVQIHTADGHLVTAPNTREAGIPISVRGPGVLEYDLGPCMLLPGTYDLSVAATDKTGLDTHDFRYRTLRFDVGLGVPRHNGGGVVALGGTWAHRPTTP